MLEGIEKTEQHLDNLKKLELISIVNSLAKLEKDNNTNLDNLIVNYAKFYAQDGDKIPKKLIQNLTNLKKAQQNLIEYNIIQINEYLNWKNKKLNKPV
jgi:ribosomal protein L18E